MVSSDDVRVVLHVRGSVFTVCVLLRLLLSVPVHASLNRTLVAELQDNPKSLCDISAASGCRGGWGYGKEIGPEHWPGACTAGKHQSPVDLEQEEAKTASWERLVFFNYKSAAVLKVTNNGHSVIGQITENCPRGVGAGGLPGVYYLLSLHFHWKSEHMISGKRFPLELHIVHVKNKYKSINEARQDSTGLAYVAIFFEESRVENKALQPLLEAVKTVASTPDSTADVAGFNLASLLPDDIDTFFRYDGSLTTPDCDEIVVWTILKNTVAISSTQLQVFMDVQDRFQVKRSNKRPVQPLNDRTIFLVRSGTSRTLTRGITASLLVALSLYV